MSETAVIVGAGQAGAECALELRRNGWPGGVALLGAEPHPPYQRPPLSKAYLAGGTDRDGLRLRPADFYAKEDIALRTDAAVAAIDRAAKRVHLADGERVPYGKLVLATGARPRPFDVPGAELDGVGCLRGIADADRLRADLAGAGRLVIVGGGYIGLEVAAVARGMGRAVTVVEAAERVLARVTSPVVSRFYADVHRAQGVEILCGAALESLRGRDGRVTTAVLADGRELPCDAVLIGVGVVPNSELAAAAGLAVDDGIVVDAAMRTDDPDIHAVGDCASAWNEFAGARVRLESVANALEQGRVAARHIAGAPDRPRETPWFWSDQYDLKLQTAGLAGTRYDAAVLRGDPAARAFAVAYLRDSRLIALDAVNAPAAFNVAKRVIAKGADGPAIDPAQIADETFDLKTLMR